MRPIDTIRKSIDTDLSKYHGSGMCFISSDDDIRDIKGVGLVAIVTPLNRHLTQDEATSDDESKFPVLIVNREGKGVETNVSERYYVFVMNLVQDKSSSSVGFLVSKSFVPEIVYDKNMVDERGKKVVSMQRDNITDGQTS